MRRPVGEGVLDWQQVARLHLTLHRFTSGPFDEDVLDSHDMKAVNLHVILNEASLRAQ